MIKVPKKVLSVNLEVSILEFLQKDIAKYQKRMGIRVSLSAFVNKILEEYRVRVQKEEAETSSGDSQSVSDVGDVAFYSFRESGTP